MKDTLANRAKRATVPVPPWLLPASPPAVHAPVRRARLVAAAAAAAAALSWGWLLW